MLTALAAMAISAAHPLELVWHDEFDGKTLDRSKWTVEVNADGGGNQELQYYVDRPDNLRLDNGDLVITARNQPYTGKDGQTRPYTSGRINSHHHFATRYGRVEARMKLPKGIGMWPAFWMLGDDIDQVGWPASGEIDIMENVGQEPAMIHGSIHGPGYSGPNGLNAPMASSLTGYHVYAVDWSPERIDFYMDGHRYVARTPASLPKGGQWVFEHPFYLIVNLAVGGSWPGSPTAETTFPQELRVDYVRVWEPKP